MFLFIISFYYLLRNNYSNGKKTKLPEMQEIFSDCLAENEDKVKSSIIIETVTVKYGLNEDVKRTLINKLDPDNADILYSRDELIAIFKEWITSHGILSNALCPPFSYKSFYPSCSESTPVQSSARFRPVRLFLHDDTVYLDSDEVNGDSSQNSSSSKKKLIHHRSLLKSKLHNTELHADSLEKKYESVSMLCENQKIELERLRKELQNKSEEEQRLEEMIQQRRNKELQLEKKYAKAQEELTSAYSKIEYFDTMEMNYKQNISEALENARKWQASYSTVKDMFERVEVELRQKNDVIAKLESDVISLNAIKENNDSSISILIDENMALNNKLNDMQNCSMRNIPVAYQYGIPLCQELPSEMLLFPYEESGEESTENRESINERLYSCQETQTDDFESNKSQELSEEIIFNQKNDDENKNYCRSQETQIEYHDIEWIYSCQETQTDKFESPNIQLYSCQTQTDKFESPNRLNSTQETQTFDLDNRLYSCQETQTDKFEKLHIRLNCTQETQTYDLDNRLLADKCNQTVKMETKNICFQVCPVRKIAHSQTVNRLLTSRDTQTDTVEFRRKHIQRVDHHLTKWMRIIGRTFVSILTSLIVIFCLISVFLHYCHNNECFQLRYPRGPPPV